MPRPHVVSDQIQLLRIGLPPGTIFPFQRFSGGRSGDRRHAFHVIHKPHVVVPLVMDLEWLNTITDRMIGKVLKFGAQCGLTTNLDHRIHPSSQEIPFGSPFSLRVAQ